MPDQDPIPDQTFTQADVDRIVKERLERAKAKFADYDDLKARAAKLEELERAQMDGEQRKAKDLQALADRLAEAERARDEALAQGRDRLLRAEVTMQAAAMGFAYPADIYRLADLSQASIDESGSVAGIQEALSQLAKDRPDYLRRQSAPGIDGGATGPGNDLPRLTPAQERIAKEMGISLEAYAKRLAQQSTT